MTDPNQFSQKLNSMNSRWPVLRAQRAVGLCTRRWVRRSGERRTSGCDPAETGGEAPENTLRSGRDTLHTRAGVQGARPEKAATRRAVVTAPAPELPFLHVTRRAPPPPPSIYPYYTLGQPLRCEAHFLSSSLLSFRIWR